QIPSILKIPEMKKSSIAVGIDDGQVYGLNEVFENSELKTVNIKISLQANEFISTDLSTVDRYTELLNKGFRSQRGVLNFSRGKYFMHIPFTKKVSEERDNDLIASADLGLKTLATLSIYKKTKEIDRQFLDQKHLGGKKTDWFKNSINSINLINSINSINSNRLNRLNKLNKLNKLNLKGKLMDRRLLAILNQSIRMMSRKGTMRHWFAREREKTQWRKISNIHKELIRQISCRIISYLNYHNVGTLILENLKWSTHNTKSQSGYFLATWQVHWFFSQVQSMLTNQARLHGIRVELVNPRNSSKICWLCAKTGNRAGKQFYCTEITCQISHLDSDLNAARNLIQRSKKYKRYNLSQFSDAIS
ncbi:MAG: zinc ribbon domain-containing protein, partial [Candidatus Heimdallarchaeota archaeon]